MGHINYRHLLSASHGIRTIGTYYQHHMEHTNYRHLSASHGTHKLSAPTISMAWDKKLSAPAINITWDTQTIGTYYQHDTGHKNYRHLLSASHGTQTIGNFYQHQMGHTNYRHLLSASHGTH